MMFDLLTTLTEVPADYQAERAADAAWETARWTWWLVAATFLLFGGAVAAAIYAARSWSAANGQLNIMMEDRERNEATNVSAWLHQERPAGMFDVRLRNANHAPVYDVMYRVCGRIPGQNEPTIREFRNLPESVLAPSPEVGYKPVHQISSEGFLKGDKNAFFSTGDDWKPWNGSEAEAGVFLELSFRDSKGIQWRRDAFGTLSKISA